MDSCANPVGSPVLRLFTSFQESRQVAASPCCQRHLPDSILQIFPQMPGPLPRRSPRVLLPVSSSRSSAFPKALKGRLPVCSANATFPRALFFEVADISLCSGLRVCLPLRSLLPLRVSPQGSRDFYIRAYRASLPPHAPDMLSVRTGN